MISAQRTQTGGRGAFIPEKGFRKNAFFTFRFLSSGKGLSLIEVLLAVAILAFGILGVLRGYAAAIAALETQQITVTGVNLLKQKMADIEQMVIEREGEALPEGDSGRFETPFEDFSWRWEALKTDLEGLRVMTLVISSEVNPRTFSVGTYVVDEKTEE